MKWNKTLLIFTLGFLLINFLFLKNSETLSGGRAMIYLYIFPLFWLATLITVGIVAYRNRKEWFSKRMRSSTILFLILCTPLSIWGLSVVTRPEIKLTGTGYFPKNGITIKTETWIYNSGQTAIRKFWKLDTENRSKYDEGEFTKDSTWVYFDKKGDTLKTETYKNDQLIKKTEFKK